LNKMEMFRSRFLRLLLSRDDNIIDNTVEFESLIKELMKQFIVEEQHGNKTIYNLNTSPEILFQIETCFYKRRKEIFFNSNIEQESLTPINSKSIKIALQKLKEPPPFKKEKSFDRAIAISLYPLEDIFLLYAENDNGTIHISFYPYKDAENKNTNQTEIYRSLIDFIEATNDRNEMPSSKFNILNSLAGPTFIVPIYEALEKLEWTKDRNTLVFLVGHHWTGQLPIHALSPKGSEESLLDESVTCVYLPSLSFLSTIIERREIDESENSTKNGVIYGNLLEKDTSGLEVFLQQIANLMPTEKNKIIIGNDLNIEHILELPDHISDFFIVAHGNNVKDNAFLSCMFINTKRPLFVNDLLNVKPKDIDIAVTASCLSYLSTRYPGDELLGIAYSFILLGAKSIVANLLSVSDKETKQILLNFYNARKNGLNKAQALQSARRCLRWNGLNNCEKWDSIYTPEDEPPEFPPYYWAGPVLIGDPF